MHSIRIVDPTNDVAREQPRTALDLPEHVEVEQSEAFRTWQLLWLLERQRRRRWRERLRARKA